MATTYILYSKTIDKHYIGSCLNLPQRITQHNNHNFDLSFTKRATDWSVIFKIDNLDYQQARNIEKHIKKMKSKSYIQNLIKYPNISEKLILKYA